MSGNDTHADTIHRSTADYIDRTIETVRNHRNDDSSWTQWANIFADEIEDLRADVERERARADRAEAALAFYAERRNYQHAAPGPRHDLTTCPIALADTFDADDGPGSRARAALSAGSGGRETSEEPLIQVSGPPGSPPLWLTKDQYDALVNTGGRETT